MAQSWVPGDEKLSRIYGALLALADAEHAFVNFVHGSLVEPGEQGSFLPKEETEGASPDEAPFSEISLVRNYPLSEKHTPARNAEEGLSELITLAHELGHMRSWKAKLRTPAYIAASRLFEIDAGALSADQRLLILEEERCAWEYGRKELEALGFDRWAAFNKDLRAALRGYEERLTAKGASEP